MKNISMTGVALGILAVTLMAGCASTQIVSEWKSPEIENKGPYRKVFLTAITGEDAVRRQVEDAFQSVLSPLNVTGITSYQSLPESEKPGKDKLVKAVKDSGADAALVMRMVKKESRISVTPPMYGPSGYYHGYYSAWDNYYSPSSVYQYEVVTLEAKLYDVASEKLLLAMNTETTDAGKLQKEIAAYAKLICDRLAEFGVFPAVNE